MLYLRAQSFIHQLQLLSSWEVFLFYIVLTATVASWNFSGVYASKIIKLQAFQKVESASGIRWNGRTEKAYRLGRLFLLVSHLDSTNIKMPGVRLLLQQSLREITRNCYIGPKPLYLDVLIGEFCLLSFVWK